MLFSSYLIWNDQHFTKIFWTVCNDFKSIWKAPVSSPICAPKVRVAFSFSPWVSWVESGLHLQSNGSSCSRMRFHNVIARLCTIDGLHTVRITSKVLATKMSWIPCSAARTQLCYLMHYSNSGPPNTTQACCFCLLPWNNWPRANRYAAVANLFVPLLLRPSFHGGHPVLYIADTLLTGLSWY